MKTKDLLNPIIKLKCHSCYSMNNEHIYPVFLDPYMAPGSLLLARILHLLKCSAYHNTDIHPSGVSEDRSFDKPEIIFDVTFNSSIYSVRKRFTFGHVTTKIQNIISPVSIPWLLVEVTFVNVLLFSILFTNYSQTMYI